MTLQPSKWSFHRLLYDLFLYTQKAVVTEGIAFTKDFDVQSETSSPRFAVFDSVLFDVSAAADEKENC